MDDIMGSNWRGVMSLAVAVVCFFVMIPLIWAHGFLISNKHMGSSYGVHKFNICMYIRIYLDIRVYV